MTAGEWSCLISFAWDLQSCSERERERKIQNENICLQRVSIPFYATPQQVNQRFRPLGHAALMMTCGLMSYRIVGYKLIKPLRDNTCQIDYDYMCI